MRGIQLRGNRHRLHGTGALLGLDLTDRRFQTLALGGYDIDIGNVLLAKAGFQRLACRLIDASPDFRIGAIRPIQRASDGRF